MKILHYALGFPPYRTGGLTKYCTDLMLTQKEQGNCVALLWPGQMGFIGKRTRIRKNKNWNDIISFELINPLPVALDEGIQDIDAFTQSVAFGPYQSFLKDYAPDVIHIHTLMGLHKEFIDVANRLKIKTVYTSHDYFGICPKVTLFHDNEVCDDDHDCADCIRCNQTALSLKKIMILQSPLYRKVKNTGLVRLLRNQHRKKFFDGREAIHERKDNRTVTADDYRILRQYYLSMLESIDAIHFNSSVTKAVYERYIQPQKSAVLAITHRDIKDHRHIKNFNHEKLRITYLGPAKPFKGFQFLISTLDELWASEVQDFELHIYAETAVEREYLTHKQAGYPYSQLEDIFENTDLLVAPSQWYETFGFTVLEALSYGVPVLVTNNVGAKDLINGNFGFICQPEVGSLKALLRQAINVDCLKEKNQAILRYLEIPDLMESCGLY